MKHFTSAIVLLLFFACSNSQSSVDVDYSKGICECLDSLNKTAGTEHNFPICFGLMLDKNSRALKQELIKTYGDISNESMTKLTDQLEISVSIQLVNSCTPYFKFVDSTIHQQYKNLNKDSLNKLLTELESIDTTKRNMKYFISAGTLYFQLGEYENAMKNADEILSKDSTNTTALFIKASIDDARGNYQDAISLYDRVAQLSHQNSIYIYSALAKRKKKGL